MSMAQVTIVVLNTNRREDTLTCLASLAQSTYTHHHVIVLDNGSTDGSLEAIHAAFPAVQTVRLAENRGYAGNNNVGICLALEQGADWVFVLNEDTTVAPDCLDNLMMAAAAGAHVGVVGPMVYTWGDGRTISSAGGRVDWRLADAINEGAGEPDTGQYPARPVDFINGCGLLISRAAIESAGLLDETIFIYYEETDWCQRVRKAGFDLHFVPSAQMRHKAPIHWDNAGPSTIYYMTRNRIRFFARHAPQAYWAESLAHALYGAFRGAYSHWRAGRHQHARAIAYAIWHALSRRWGRVDASLWRTDPSDRALSFSAARRRDGR